MAATAAAADQMAYSQVYTQVQTIGVLHGDQFWGAALTPFAIEQQTVCAGRISRRLPVMLSAQG